MKTIRDIEVGFACGHGRDQYKGTVPAGTVVGTMSSSDGPIFYVQSEAEVVKITGCTPHDAEYYYLWVPGWVVETA